MTFEEASSQTSFMRSLIINEAQAKESEIVEQGLKEFEIEKAKIMTAEREKITAEFSKKKKIVETQCAIKRSMAINRSRLDKVVARQEVIGSLATEASAKLVQEMAKESESKKFYIKLILQGLLMLLEDEVTVQCRECDAKTVEGCLKEASDEYTKIIKTETNANKTVKLSLSKSFLAPPPVAGSDAASCLGGVLLLCQGGSIKIDNTIDARLSLVLEQDKPAIRKLLFPLK